MILEDNQFLQNCLIKKKNKSSYESKEFLQVGMIGENKVKIDLGKEILQPEMKNVDDVREEQLDDDVREKEKEEQLDDDVKEEHVEEEHVHDDVKENIHVEEEHVEEDEKEEHVEEHVKEEENMFNRTNIKNDECMTSSINARKLKIHLEDILIDPLEIDIIEDEDGNVKKKKKKARVIRI